MEFTQALREDPKKPLVVDDNTYSLVIAIEQLTKAIDALVAVSLRGGR